MPYKTHETTSAFTRVQLRATLPPAQEFPPSETGYRPDRDRRERHDQPQPPPVTLGNVVGAKIDGRRRGAVVSERCAQGREIGENKPGHPRGRPGRDRSEEHTSELQS